MNGQELGYDGMIVEEIYFYNNDTDLQDNGWDEEEDVGSCVEILYLYVS